MKKEKINKVLIRSLIAGGIAMIIIMVCVLLELAIRLFGYSISSMESLVEAFRYCMFFMAIVSMLLFLINRKKKS